MGIGSEGYEAIRMGRKFIGCELKKSYFDIAIKNLIDIEEQVKINGPQLEIPKFHAFKNRESYGLPKNEDTIELKLTS